MLAKSAIILATNDDAFRQLWGMTILERLLRQLSDLGIRKATVVHSQPEDFHLRGDFSAWTNIDVEQSKFAAVNEFDLKAQLQPEERTLVLEAQVVLDIRVLELLAKSNQDVRIDADSLLANLGPNFKDICDVKATDLASISSYLQTTRKKVLPYVVTIAGENDLNRARKLSFDAVYKGATDFITKYVFFYPTRWIVDLISPTQITPNQITVLSMFLSFGAIIPFFTGNYLVALIMGFCMAWLDTIDGKLARVTLRTSKSGDLLDHVSDTVYLFFWYIGFGWSLSGGELLNFNNHVAQVHAVLISAFIFDKCITGLFKKIYGFLLHDYTRLDYAVRIFIARRNPFLLCLLFALILNKPVFALYWITLWYLATAMFHTLRFVYIPLSGKRHQFEAK